MEQITIREIARICGVGVSTVSRAINNHPDINPETKQMILDTIREYNYIPNNSARNLKRTDSNTIAVMVKGIGNPFFADMLASLESNIVGREYLFVMQQVEEEENEVEAAIQLEKEKRLKGIVFLGGSAYQQEDLLRQLSVPYILSTVDARLPEQLTNCGVVAVDNEDAMYRMVDHLCSCGHSRIAILTAWQNDQSVGKLRLDGYRRALEAHGIPYDESLVIHMDRDVQTYTIKNGYQVTKRLLESGMDISCICAISDTLAIGACKAIIDAGLRVPEDISVTGFDGLDIARYYNPSITTIVQPVDGMADETIRLLFRLIHKEETAKMHLFRGELLEGQSVKKLREDN